MPTEKLPTYRETTAGSKCQCYCTGPRDQSCYCGWWVFFLIVDFSIGTCDFCARRAPATSYSPPQHRSPFASFNGQRSC